MSSFRCASDIVYSLASVDVADGVANDPLSMLDGDEVQVAVDLATQKRFVAVPVWWSWTVVAL